MDEKTLIILPGWGGTKETWAKFAELAKNDFDVQVINLPCFGGEPCPDTVWGVENYVEFVRGHLERSAIGTKSKDLDQVRDSSSARWRTQNDVILLGHSFGGQIASFFASKYPEMIDKLILSGPAVFRPKKYTKRAILYSISKICKLFFKLPLISKYESDIKNIFYNLIRARDYSESSGIKRDIFKKIIRQDLSRVLSDIKTPTLIIWGGKDRYVPLSDARKLNKLISDSKLEIIKGGKHGLHLQMPNRLYKLVYDFSY